MHGKKKNVSRRNMVPEIVYTVQMENHNLYNLQHYVKFVWVWHLRQPGHPDSLCEIYKNKLQLILEYEGFELPRSIYTWHFLVVNIIYYTIHGGLDLHMQNLECRRLSIIHTQSLTMQRVRAWTRLIPVQGSAVFWKTSIMIINHL